MPPHNNFRHHTYSAELPSCPPEIVSVPPLPADPEEVRRRMACAGCSYRAAGVRVIYLVHGTFTGTDALDLACTIGHLASSIGVWARRNQKALVDALFGDLGNFTSGYAAQLEAALAGASGEVIPVRLFHWSSQNHHVGRADAALRLLDELMSHDFAGGRVLLCGHSHGGNVFALLTNLLGAEVELRRRFFDALRIYYGPRGPGADLLRRIESAFQEEKRPLADMPLDFVTLGTPVRYGWDSGGYARLLHFIYHRCRPECEPHVALFPFQLDDILNTVGGDYVQQIGIAGTNFTPHLLAWRTWRSELRLNALLQPELRSRDLASRLTVGMRIPSDGKSLLVDYAHGDASLARSIAGHAVYTRREFMLFHAEEIAKRLYDASPDPCLKGEASDSSATRE
jgi:hypothetical protein